MEDVKSAIQAGDWAKARELAIQLGISSEYVAKHQFLAEHDLKVLETVQDRDWVAAACLDLDTADIGIQSRLLEIGLNASSEPISYDSLSGDDDNDTLPKAVLVRGALLELSDRLRTYKEVYSATASPDDDTDGWAELEDDPHPSIEQEDVIPLQDFLNENIYDLAIRAAVSNSLNLLRSLYKRHRLKSRQKLHLAEQLPYSTPPEELIDFLPFDTSIRYEPWRSETDWSEANPPDSNVDEVTATELQNWLIIRVEAIDARSNLVDNALSLVQHAATKGIEGLDELGEDLSLLTKLIYDRTDDSLTDEEWSLSKWRSSQPEKIFSAYLAESTSANVVRNIRSLALPYAFVVESKLERKGTPDPTLHDRLLRQYMFQCSQQSRFDLLSATIEASKPTLPSSQRIIRQDVELARVALATLYASTSLESWSDMAAIFECLPAFDSSNTSNTIPSSFTEDVLSLFIDVKAKGDSAQIYNNLKGIPVALMSRCLDFLDVHLESAETFARWNAPVPLIWFMQHALDASAQRSIATKMVRVASSGTNELESEDEWDALKEDLCKMAAQDVTDLPTALGQLSEVEVLSIFFSGLLKAGHFSMAKSLFNPSSGARPIDPIQQENLVLDASRELYDNADSGNLHQGSMKLAYECLSAAPPTPTVRKEREFIEATSRLASFHLVSPEGLPVVPLQIRLTADKLQLIAQLLSSNEDAHRHPEVILDLVSKLGYRGDSLAKIRALSLIFNSCVQASDYAQAADIAEDMVKALEEMRRRHDEQANVPSAETLAWAKCFQIGRNPSFRDDTRKLSLLGHALLICPPSETTHILVEWRMVEERIITGQSQTPLPAAATSPRLTIQTQLPSTAAAAESARSIGRAAAQFLRTPSPMRPASPSAAHALDALFIGREGGVRDKLNQRFGKGINWLVGAEE